MADRPWWQTTNTACVGFMLGILWTAFGLSQLLVAVSTPHHRATFVVSLVGAVVFLALGGGYLVTAALLRRRERRGTPGQPGFPRPPD